MFTGLVEHVGTIESVELCDVGAPLDSNVARTDQIGARIRVRAGPLIKGLAKSGSIAVNGCCLTVVDIQEKVSPPIFPARRCAARASVK